MWISPERDRLWKDVIIYILHLNKNVYPSSNILVICSIIRPKLIVYEPIWRGVGSMKSPVLYLKFIIGE